MKFAAKINEQLSGRILQLRENIQFAAANLPTYLSAIRQRRHLPYGENPRQRLDVYAATGAVNRPIVVFWYGGCWSGGSKSDYRFVGAALAARGYCVVVSDYRVHPEVVFPSFIDDAARALVYTRRNARAWGGDPERIVVMGHSAGAQLAAMLAYNPKYLDAAGGDRGWISAFVGLSGAYALMPHTDHFRKIFADPYSADDWQPIRHIDRQSPPTLLIQGQNDSFLKPTEAGQVREVLAKKGVHVEMEMYPGRSHEDIVAAFSLVARHRAPSLDRTTRFITNILSAAPKSTSRRVDRSTPIRLNPLERAQGVPAGTC